MMKLNGFLLGCAVLALGCGKDGDVIATGGAGGTGPGSTGALTGSTTSPSSATSTGSMTSGTSTTTSSSSGSGGGTGSPRLFVAGGDGAGHGLFIWNDPDTLAADAPPDVTVSDTSTVGATGLGVGSAHLYVSTNQAASALVTFSGPDTMTAGSAPEAVIPRTALSGSTGAMQHILVEPSTGPLFVGSFTDGSYVFPSTPLTSASVPTARFAHSFQQTPSLAWDATSNRLFEGQISGAGLLAWNTATAATGAPTQDFAIPNTAVWALAIAQGKVFGGGSYGASPSAPGVGVWSSVPSAATAPAFVLGAANGIAAGTFVDDVTVSGNVLIVCLQNGNAGHRVLVWNDIGTLTAASTPDETIMVATEPKRATLSAGGKLYVISSAGVSIFATPTSTPSLVATIKGSLLTFNDFVLSP